MLKKLEETKSNWQKWIRYSQPLVSGVLESFPLLQKNEYVILMYSSDTLIMTLMMLSVSVNYKIVFKHNR